MGVLAILTMAETEGPGAHALAGGGPGRCGGAGRRHGGECGKEEEHTGREKKRRGHGSSDSEGGSDDAIFVYGTVSASSAADGQDRSSSDAEEGCNQDPNGEEASSRESVSINNRCCRLPVCFTNADDHRRDDANDKVDSTALQ